MDGQTFDQQVAAVRVMTLERYATSRSVHREILAMYLDTISVRLPRGTQDLKLEAADVIITERKLVLAREELSRCEYLHPVQAGMAGEALTMASAKLRHYFESGFSQQEDLDGAKKDIGYATKVIRETVQG